MDSKTKNRVPGKTELRHHAARKAGWNVFAFPAELLSVDLLTDSGTAALSDIQLEQWQLGEEPRNRAYAGRSSNEMLREELASFSGIPDEESEIFLTPQGRGAEYLLFKNLADNLRETAAELRDRGERLCIPSNGHFDTTRANVLLQGMYPCDLGASSSGNMDCDTLAHVLRERSVPLVFTTVTNNTRGGTAVSLSNLRRIRALCDAHNLPLILDACRIAENAWFIQQHEPRYRKHALADIIRKMFAMCDGFTISFKKCLSHTGGALVLRKRSPLTDRFPDLAQTMRDFQTIAFSNPNQGGLSGGDQLVIARGLREVVDPAFLANRIKRVRRFARQLAQRGIPVREPYGGHAVYIDMDRFLHDTRHERTDFGGISLSALLLLCGIRVCELGAFAFGEYNAATGQEEGPAFNHVRCAVPARGVDDRALDDTAQSIAYFYAHRHRLPRAVPTYGRELPLRHFTAQFRLETL